MVIPVYCCPSMLRTAYLIDWEHAWSNQNWFINACAEQPKMVKKHTWIVDTGYSDFDVITVSFDRLSVKLLH